MAESGLDLGDSLAFESVYPIEANGKLFGPRGGAAELAPRLDVAAMISGLEYDGEEIDVDAFLNDAHNNEFADAEL